MFVDNKNKRESALVLESQDMLVPGRNFRKGFRGGHGVHE